MDTIDDQPTSPDNGDAADATSYVAPLWAAPVRGAWALCWRRPGLWFLILAPAVAVVVLQSVQIWLTTQATQPTLAGTALVLLARVLGLIALAAGVALMFAMAREGMGTPLSSVRAAYQRIWDLGAALLGAGCLAAVVAFISVTAISTVMLTIATTSTTVWVWVGLAMVVLVWRPFIASIFWFHGIVLAQRGPLESVGDAWRLTGGRVLALTPYVLFTSMPLVIYMASQSFQPRPRGANFTTWWAMAAAYGLFGVIWSVFTTALWLLLWYRSRVEADDLTLTHFAAELNPSLPVPEPPHQRTVVARDEPRVAPTTPLRRRRRR